MSHHVADDHRPGEQGAESECPQGQPDGTRAVALKGMDELCARCGSSVVAALYAGRGLCLACLLLSVASTDDLRLSTRATGARCERLQANHGIWPARDPRADGESQLLITPTIPEAGNGGFGTWRPSRNP
jgi:hypothetical protein